MGNYVSCKVLTDHTTPYLPTAASKATRVIFPNGEIRRVQLPAIAAEVMIERPSVFIVDTKSLKLGRRFAPLNAEDELHRSTVYAMFPMRRKNSAVTAGDLGALFLAANSSSKGNHMVKVSPEKLQEGAGDCAEEDDDVGQGERAVTLEELVTSPEFFRYRLSMCRSKKPLLETIVEENVKLAT